jgi:uncharacterized phage protein (TIGR02218 family)
MAYPLGGNCLSTLRATAHWHADLFDVVPRLDPTRALYLSSLDRQMRFEGRTYRPTAGELSDEELAAGMSGGDTQIMGALSPGGITLVNVQRGLWDEAEVVHRIVDWRRPTKHYLMQVWWIDEIEIDGRAWKATLSSSARFLQSTIGDVYHGSCPAVLGDDRCKATVPTYSGAVATVTDARHSFTLTGLPSLPDGRFRRGSVTWLTGNNRGTKSDVVESTAGTAMTLSSPTRFRIRVGDTFTARPGCDGLATTCKDVYGNLPNYRGNERQKNSKQLILNRGTVT